VHWLIDTEQRLGQYLELADALEVRLDIALELDVGLHRGGFVAGPELRRVLERCLSAPNLRLSGVMGYDAHVAKAPEVLGLRRRSLSAAQKAYSDVLAMVAQIHEQPLQIRNAGGSPTFRLHRDTTVANEVAVGSALLKPTDFDTDLLAQYLPALFIATPAIKVSGRMQTPVLEALDPVKRALDPNLAKTVFIHGGYWKARPEDPPGLTYNATYGRSSNQEVLNGGAETELYNDDFVFLRPTQSEAVLMQFGKIAVYEDGAITGYWAPFPLSV
jgi:D-serine deaminase-like pyridoxal phosphate-dependent protein